MQPEQSGDASASSHARRRRMWTPRRLRSRIEAVGEWLYRGSWGRREPPRVRHHRLHTHEALWRDVPRKWEDETRDGPSQTPTSLSAVPARPSLFHRASVVLFVGAVLFFVGAIAVSLYVWMSGVNSVSTKLVTLAVEGPAQVAGGEVVPLRIRVVNRNPTAIEDAVLAISFPPGARREGDFATPLTVEQRPLGDLAPGEERVEEVRVAFFGEQGKEKELKVRLEFSLSGSRAVFYRTALYRTLLVSAPVVLRMDALGEVVTGQLATFRVEVSNNTPQPLHNLVLTVAVPPGMEVREASPPPTAGTVWRIDTLTPRQPYEVLLTVLPTAVEGEVRTFHLAVGEEHPSTPGKVAAPFGELSWDVRIAQPFVRLAIAVGDTGEGEEAVEVPAGTVVPVRLAYTNTLSVPLYDLTLEVQLEGKGFAPDQVSVADGGIYDARVRRIRWHPREVSSLREVPPGGGGEVRFSVGTLLPQHVRSAHPAFRILAYARARRVLETQVPETLSIALQREVRLSSTPLVQQRTLYYSGPFANRGPLPPRVGEETTYTIVWRLDNPVNPLEDVVVRGTLPSYVRWVGAVAPAGESLSYNEVSGTVTWRIPSVPAGVGTFRPAREVAFQVAVTPVFSQARHVLTLVSALEGRARDAFTGASTPLRAPAATTELADPEVSSGEARSLGEVVPADAEEVW